MCASYLNLDTIYMLPLTLQLKNFLSYREDVPTLNLEDIHVACLCGPNGHGKSAILDAITWSLWGKARGRTHDQLVHEGQNEMSVGMEFENEGQRYNVVRRFSRARKNTQSSLELLIYSNSDWIPITLDTVKQTEMLIERTVNMDYETFVNSAYLIQGRSDLFTMATPSQRKNVLSSILGLGIYDRLSERAKKSLREAQQSLNLGDEIIRRLELGVSDRSELENNLKQVETEINLTEDTFNSVEKELTQTREQLALLHSRGEDIDEMGKTAEKIKSWAVTTESEIGDIKLRIEKWESSMVRASEIENGYKELQSARDELSRLSTKSNQVKELEGELNSLSNQISTIKNQLKFDLSTINKRVTEELDPLVTSVPSLKEKVALNNLKIQELTQAEVEIEQLVDLQKSLLIQSEGLKSQNETLKKEGQATRGKLDLLKSHSHDGELACPLCRSLLGNEGRFNLESNYQIEIQEQLDLYAKHSKMVEQIDAQIADSEQNLKQRRTILSKNKTALEEERVRLGILYEEAQQATKSIELERLSASKIEKELSENNFALAEFVRYRDIKSLLENLDFDFRYLEILAQKTDSQKFWEAEHQSLIEARSRLNDDRGTLESALIRHRESSDELVRIQQQIENAKSEISELPELESVKSKIESRYNELHTKKNDLHVSHGSISQRLDQISESETELKIQKESRSKIENELSILNDLAIAFGRGGVQALLIEAAIPRLEDETNSLLSRMTDGRMALQLHTQRERRTSKEDDPIETLEVTISDEIGTRPYEMFSGGERFRVDLALRIALSKLLAWRSGAQLPTLFIDEGFGTQDADGRDKIVDVIKAIEDQFKRILVITHMDEIKEAFPVRIEVSREAGSGSTFSIT